MISVFVVVRGSAEECFGMFEDFKGKRKIALRCIYDIKFLNELCFKTVSVFCGS